jgi:hypothetical protein
MFCCSCGNRRFGIVFLWAVLTVQAVFLLSLFIGLVLRPTENDLKSPENVLKSPENGLIASGNVLKTPVVLAEREVWGFQFILKDRISISVQ